MKGSTVESFEELNVYKQARDLTKTLYETTREGSFSKDEGLVDQIRQGSVLIMSNIALGFERESNAEFIQSLYVAKGSCGKVRAQLTVAFDQNYILVNQYNDLNEQCHLIQGMLSNLISYIKKAKGPKLKKLQN